MKALLLFLIIYVIYKLIRSLFSKASNILGSNKKKPEESIKRYNTKGEKIEEADFEEIQ